MISVAYETADVPAEQADHLRQISIDYMMAFFPVPVLRKNTKRGRLRYEGKLRAREAIRKLYDPR